MVLLTANQIDALCELGNIGASHAATTLSQMLMGAIEMTVPSVEVVDLADIYKHVSDDISVLVIFELQGELEHGGYIIFLMPISSAIRLTNTMLGMAEEEREMTEMDESAVNEIGNIMVSSFLDATAELLGIIMLPSPPVLVIDMGHAAIEQLIAEIAVDVNEVVFFHTKLVSTQYAIDGDILMIPEINTLTRIVTMMDQLLNQYQA